MASIYNDLLSVTCSFIILFEMIIGVSSTLFITAVIVNESKQRKSIKPGNRIRIALNISNICYVITVFAKAMSGSIGHESDQMIDSTSMYVVYSLNMFTMSSSCWLTAALGFFYFLKIVDFQAGAILWAKKNINAVVPWMIMGIEVIAGCSSFLGMLLFINPHSSSISNSTVGSYNSLSNHSTGFLSIALLVSCAPFLIFLVTFSCVARSLVKHHQSMVDNKGTSANNMKRFGQSVWKVKRILLVFTFYYLFVILYHVATFFNWRVEAWVFLLIISSFIPLSSTIMIIVNPKLRKTAMEMLSCAICCG